MPCAEYQPNAWVCSPPRGVKRRRILRCWNCETRRRVIETHLGIWYGSSFVCLHCGDGWGCGERMERPFQRGWRQKAAAKAREDWANALPAAEYEAIVNAELEAELRALGDAA
jgi:hypothetical protein